VYRLETIADIGERAAHDHAHRVIEVTLAHLVFDIDANDFFGEICHELAFLGGKKGRRKSARGAYTGDSKSTSEVYHE
jgi:hypothetical protein